MSEYANKIDPKKRKMHAKVVAVLTEAMEDEDVKIRLQAAKASTEFLRAFGLLSLKAAGKPVKQQMQDAVDAVGARAGEYAFKVVPTGT